MIINVIFSSPIIEFFAIFSLSQVDWVCICAWLDICHFEVIFFVVIHLNFTCAIIWLCDVKCTLDHLGIHTLGWDANWVCLLHIAFACKRGSMWCCGYCDLVYKYIGIFLGNVRSYWDPPSWHVGQWSHVIILCDHLGTCTLGEDQSSLLSLYCYLLWKV